MKANAPVISRKRLPQSRGRHPFVSAQTLQSQYEAATALLLDHFPLIDAWLGEHEPELWRQIRRADDELFRLRQLGVSESRYQAELTILLALCQQAERLYCEAEPQTLCLPPLAEGERVAVYFELADGSLQKAQDLGDYTT
jgi:hypothetical protein